MATKLAAGEVSDLDPYKFMAVIDKRVIHPGGQSSTEALLARVQITASARVLDVACPQDGLAHATHSQSRPLPRLHPDRRHQARMSVGRRTTNDSANATHPVVTTG